MIKKPQGTKRRKFIDFLHHYIRKKLDDGQTTIENVPDVELKEGMFTKPLRRVELQRECRILRISTDQIGRNELASSSQGDWRISGRWPRAP